MTINVNLNIPITVSNSEFEHIVKGSKYANTGNDKDYLAAVEILKQKCESIISYANSGYISTDEISWQLDDLNLPIPEHLNDIDFDFD